MALLSKPAHAALTGQLVLPPSPKALWVGDSYTEGVGATAKTKGFAYLAAPVLGWTATIDGKGGSGYCNPTTYGAGVYNDRLLKFPVDAYDLVVLQGSSNDEKVVNGVYTYSDATITAAINKTLQTVRTRYPRAKIVMVGPANPYGSAGADRLRINRLLTDAATANAVIYIDTIKERWFAPGDGTLFANASLGHPNDAGYALMRTAFVRDIQVLTTGG